MKSLLRQESIRPDSSGCPNCSQNGSGKFVIEDENTRYCGTCWQDLGPRTDIPMPLWHIIRLAKRLGRSAQFSLVEAIPAMEQHPSHVYGVDARTELNTLSLMMQHRTQPDLRCKIEWFTVPKDKAADHKAVTVDNQRLRAYAGDAVCQAVDAIVKPLRGNEYDGVTVTQVSFQPCPGRCFIRFELTFWFDTMSIPGTLQIMRGELSWATAGQPALAADRQSA